MAFERKDDGGKSAGNANEDAEKEIDFHDRVWTTGRSLNQKPERDRYIRSGIGIPSKYRHRTIVSRNTSAQTALLCLSASSFSFRIGYLW